MVETSRMLLVQECLYLLFIERPRIGLIIIVPVPKTTIIIRSDVGDNYNEPM